MKLRKKRIDNARFIRKPDNPNKNKRSFNHDYTLPSKYMITMFKAPSIPTLSKMEGDFKVSNHHRENYPHFVSLPPGEAIEEAIKEWQTKYDEIIVDEYAIMPDHVNLCVRVIAELEVGLSRAVSYLMGRCSRIYHDRQYGKDDADSPFVSMFKSGFNDSIAYTLEQYGNQMQYVRENPRRLLIKRHYRDFYLTTWILTINNKTYMAKGNIFILKNPGLVQVRFSRKYSEEFWKEEQARYFKCLRNGGAVISPYIHPKEKEIREMAIKNGNDCIRICENGFSERFAPSKREFELMQTGKLLLIAPPEYENRKQEMKYVMAMELNAMAAEIANAPYSSMNFRRK